MASVEFERALYDINKGSNFKINNRKKINFLSFNFGSILIWIESRKVKKRGLTKDDAARIP